MLSLGKIFYGFSMLNLSEKFFYRDRKVPRVILENWESLVVWCVIN